jgi:hypothetical protein
MSERSWKPGIYATHFQCQNPNCHVLDAEVITGNYYSPPPDKCLCLVCGQPVEIVAQLATWKHVESDDELPEAREQEEMERGADDTVRGLEGSPEQ